jgi:hypothetical protein
LNLAKIGSIFPSLTTKRLSDIIKDLPLHAIAINQGTHAVPQRIQNLYTNKFLSKTPLSMEAIVVIVETRLAHILLN